MGFIKRFLFGHVIEPFEDKDGKGFIHNGTRYVHHSDLPHHETAFYRVSTAQKLFLLILISAILWGG